MTHTYHSMAPRPVSSVTQQTFAEHLRWWRRRRGLSQLELAGAAGSSQRHLSLIESGRNAKRRGGVPGRQLIAFGAASHTFGQKRPW